MLNIHILAVGSLKENWMSAACAEYQKRIGAQFKLVVTELAEYRLPPAPSPAEICIGLQNEALAFRKKMPPRAFTAALCIEGEQLASPDFAQLLERVSGKYPAVAFLIGGSHGLDEALKREAHKRVSFSPMTFPHQFARVMLLEQLYRSGCIISGGKYHK